MGRFACGWHRLVEPGETAPPCSPVRRNHGPGRAPCLTLTRRRRSVRRFPGCAGWWPQLPPLPLDSSRPRAARGPPRPASLRWSPHRRPVPTDGRPAASRPLAAPTTLRPGCEPVRWYPAPPGRQLGGGDAAQEPRSPECRADAGPPRPPRDPQQRIMAAGPSGTGPGRDRHQGAAHLPRHPAPISAGAAVGQDQSIVAAGQDGLDGSCQRPAERADQRQPAVLLVCQQQCLGGAGIRPGCAHGGQPGRGWPRQCGSRPPSQGGQAVGAGRIGRRSTSAAAGALAGQHQIDEVGQQGAHRPRLTRRPSRRQGRRRNCAETGGGDSQLV